MRLSTKSTYGLRAMLNLAMRYDIGTTSIAHISKKEEIPVAYLEQLLNKLRHKGLVRSIRGPKGGYVLSRRPSEIAVGDVVRVLEGDTAPIYCVTGEKQLKRICKRMRSCPARVVWQKLARAIDDVLDSISLQDLRHVGKISKFKKDERVSDGD